MSQLDVPVKVTGALRVEFRGDEAAGCAAVGLCGVAGTVTWSPGEAGQIGVFTAGKGGRRRTKTVVFLGTGPFGEDATVSHVTRTLPDGSRRLCTDARPTGAVQDRPGIVVSLQGLGIIGGAAPARSRATSGPRCRSAASGGPRCAGRAPAST